MPKIYGYVRTSHPRVSEHSGSDPEISASSCWPPDWFFLTSIRV